jgi:hypothetical protein
MGAVTIAAARFSKQRSMPRSTYSMEARPAAG